MLGHIQDKHRDTPQQRKNFAYSRRVEVQYARQLRKVSTHIGTIINGFDQDDPAFLSQISIALRSYSDLIRPWAGTVARRMVLEVARRDESVWAQLGKEMGASLRQEIQTAPTGEMLRKFMAESVHYITSLPTDAAKRVHKLTLENISNSTRAKEISKEIYRSGHVSKSRADLIARTEVARTSSGLVQARAEHIGSLGYIWRSQTDSDTRPSHREMNGKYVKWDEVPTLSDGTTTHAGQIYNCFTGDTVIQLTRDAHRLWRAFYQGDLVSVVMAGAAKPLTVTLNHPMLTDRGWVAAGALQEGDYLIQTISQGDRPAEMNTDQPLTVSFDELFIALAGKRHFKRSSAETNFYGDAIDGQVDDIWSDYSLLDDFKTSRGHSLGNFDFAESDIVARPIFFGGSSHIGDASRAGLRYEAAPSFDVGLRHAREHAGTSTTPFNTSFFEQARDRPSVHAVAFGEGEFAFPPCIGSDYFRRLRVESLGRHRFAGHVFTLSTGRGYYTTTDQRLVSKNCRCWAEVVLPDHFD